MSDNQQELEIAIDKDGTVFHAPVAIHLPVDGKIIDEENFDKKFQQLLIAEKHAAKKNYERITADQQKWLKEFTETWQPLIDHAQYTANRYLPETASIRFRTNIDLKGNITFNIDLRHTMMRTYGTTEETIANITFYNWNMVENYRFGGLGKFFNTRTYNLAVSSSDKHHLTDKKLNPKKMDEAKHQIEKWLARNIANGFDQTILTPEQKQEVTVHKKEQQPDPLKI